MISDLRVIQSEDFVKLDAQGHFDPEATRNLLSDAIWACAQSRIGRVMLDIRDATGEMTAAQLGRVAGVVREVAAPTRDHKIAILTRPEFQFDNASLVAEHVQEKGWNLQVFQEFAAAMQWMMA